MPDTENNLFGHFKVSVSELDKTLRPQTLGVCGTCVARVTTRASEKVLLGTELSLREGGSGQFIVELQLALCGEPHVAINYSSIVYQ